MQTLVVIPTYNERDNILAIVARVHSICPDVHVLIVDDNSPDGTGRQADELAARDPRVTVLHRACKQGLGTAYIAGFNYGLAKGFDRVIEMDADFSHRPEDLPRLLDVSRSAHVVIGSRNVDGGSVENWSLVRKLVSRGGSLYARLMLGLPVADCTAGFKCFRREVLEALDLDQVKSNGYAFQVEMNFLCHRAGFRIEEVPVNFPDRTVGKSKMSREIVLEAASRVLELRWRSSGTVTPERPPLSEQPSRSIIRDQQAAKAESFGE